MQLLNALAWAGWKGWIERAVLTALCLGVYFIFIRGTRGAPILIGLVLILAGIFFITNLQGFDVLNWLLSQVTVYLALAMVIVFQPEIRQGLAILGKRHLFVGSGGKDSVPNHVAQAAAFLSERRIGALIAIEQQIGMRAVRASGTQMNAELSKELLATVFFPYTPLHDGGVIIKEDRIVAAGCMFPMTERDDLDRQFGARHRAAMGLADQTDAIIVIVSEETGKIALCHDGKTQFDLTPDQLGGTLGALLNKPRLFSFQTGTATLPQQGDQTA